MDCDDVILALAAREARALADVEQAALRNHLASCDACRALEAGPVASLDTVAEKRKPTEDPAIGDTSSADGVPRVSLAALTGEPVRGNSVGRFLVLDVLGSGGMGVVYSGYDPDLDRKVAIKVLRTTVIGEDRRTRLRREAQAMARIKW